MHSRAMTDPEDADGCEDDIGLRDGRCEGESETKFSKSERLQIGIEAAILFSLIGTSIYFLATIIWCVSGLEYLEDGAQKLAGGVCTANRAPLIMTSAFFFSGLIGGAVFSLKWLYHTVAKNVWHRDRFLWRISVPIMGAVLGVFITYIFSRTFGTSFAPDALTSAALLPSCGFSFLVGVFADGALASLERLARSIFGTLENFNGTK